MSAEISADIYITLACYFSLWQLRRLLCCKNGCFQQSVEIHMKKTEFLFMFREN